MVTDSRKTAIIDLELAKLKVDIAALQETRLASDGTLREQNYTFYWKGKDPDQARIHSVGFAVKNSLFPSIIPPSGSSECILSLKLSTSVGNLTLICTWVKPKIISMRTSTEKWQTFPPQTASSSLVTSTPVLEQTMRHGLPSLVITGWAP